MILIIKRKKNAACHNSVLFIMSVGDFFTTCFSPKSLLTGITYIKIIKKSYWVMSGSHVNETLFLQLIGLF